MAEQTQPVQQQTGMKAQKTQNVVVQQATGQQPAGQTQPMEEKPSIFKKWWFWVILVILGLLIGAGLYFLI